MHTLQSPYRTAYIILFTSTRTTQAYVLDACWPTVTHAPYTGHAWTLEFKAGCTAAGLTRPINQQQMPRPDNRLGQHRRQQHISNLKPKQLILMTIRNTAIGDMYDREACNKCVSLYNRTASQLKRHQASKEQQTVPRKCLQMVLCPQAVSSCDA
jgi:hypothetical protein